MYVIVAYDAEPGEREGIRAILMPKLHWIQNSVFAGELTRTATEDLYNTLRSYVETSCIVFWVFDGKADVRYLGKQEDEESIFL